MRSSVTVTGPPRAIWRRKIGTTEPDEPSTLPKRTVAKRVPGKRWRALLDRELGERLGGAHHRRRRDGLVGRDEHERADAELARDARHQPRRERVVAHRLDRVGLHQPDVLVGGGVEDDGRAVLGEHLAHPLALLAVGEHRGEHRGGWTWRSSSSSRWISKRLSSAWSSRTAAAARRARSGGRARSRSSRRRPVTITTSPTR